MSEFLGGLKRTNMCGDFRISNVNQAVTVMGWVQRRRNLGSLIFVDLRDRTGIVQVVFDETTEKSVFEKAETIRSEYVLAVCGVVRERQSKTNKIATGDVEILATELKIISESQDAGVYMVMARNGREFFITGHSEYAPNTLDGEYRRDLSKGLPIEMPKNYYREDNPDLGPVVRWRGHANLMFSNWLNYYVYQETPFDINEIR